MALKDAKEVWEAVSSRIISARLKWADTGKKRGGWSGRASSTYVSEVCAYAPTAKAPPSIKLKFYDYLKDSIDRIQHNDILVMLGDFNTRVGVLDTGNNLWQGVIWKHGLSECNFVGEEFFGIQCFKSVLNHEHLVLKEENLSRDLDASSNKEMSQDRLCRDEG